MPMSEPQDERKHLCKTMHPQHYYFFRVDKQCQNYTLIFFITIFYGLLQRYMILINILDYDGRFEPKTFAYAINDATFV